MSGSSNDVLLIGVMVGVGVILLCAVSCGIWKFKTKYEFVGGKFKVKESYLKKREAQQKKLQELRYKQRVDSPSLIDPRVTPVAFHIQSTASYKYPDKSSNKKRMPQQSKKYKINESELPEDSTRQVLNAD